MHILEELSQSDSILDTENEETHRENYEYSDEDENEQIQEEVDLILNTETKKTSQQKSDYFIHKKIKKKPLKSAHQCPIHNYRDGFVCKRKNLNTIPKDKKNQLLSENVFDITRNFNNRVKSFRRNILMAPNSPLQIEYYQDRTEFQARGNGHYLKHFKLMIFLNLGNGHIHGCAWSYLNKLEDINPGIEQTFRRLKQKIRLTKPDINTLLKLMNNSITCTNKTQNIMKFGFEEKRASKIKDSVCEVNVHHHTKTCRKNETDCRFNFPRLPSMFNIIAQELPAEPVQKDTEHEKADHKCHDIKDINFILSSVKKEAYCV